MIDPQIDEELYAVEEKAQVRESTLCGDAARIHIVPDMIHDESSESDVAVLANM